MSPVDEMMMMFNAMNPTGCACGNPDADWKDGLCDSCAEKSQIEDLEHQSCTPEFCAVTDNPYTGERA